jgi:hypothetical protein
MTYLRFIYVKYLEAIMALLGLFMYPLAYVFNYLIGWNIFIFHPWQNFDEDSTLSNWHGDANWRNAQGFERAGALKKFWIAYKWAALRNPSWNFKNWIGKGVIGEKTNVEIKINEGQGSGLTWMNKSLFGKKFATFEVNGKEHFRYSYTRSLKWWSPWQLPIPRFYFVKFYPDNLLKWVEGVLLFYWLEVKWIRTYRYINLMMGSGDTRYIFKLRFFK